MTADEIFWLAMLAKLFLTAGIVVTASVVAEWAGPLSGGLVASLPVTVGPAYVFLALDHDAAYVAAAAHNGLAVHAASGLFLLVYATLATQRGLAVSLAAAFACWLTFAFLTRSLAWSLAGAVLLNLALYPVFVWLGRNLTAAAMPRITRAWYELPMRTALVCALMALLLVTSQWAGPDVTGLIAVYPISSTSLMIILHSRVGGRASSAVLANGLWGMCGVALGLAVLGYLVEPAGEAPALVAALLVNVGWNLGVWWFRRKPAARTVGTSSAEAR